MEYALAKIDFYLYIIIFLARKSKQKYVKFYYKCYKEIISFIYINL